MELTGEFISSLDQVSAELWDSLTPNDYPFLRHAFLLGLEHTGCTTSDSGWQPCHLILRRGDDAVAVLPLYLKSHSYGEYVFDWSWADAWRSNGLSYYPKLVSAIPFTPATGPRLCNSATLDEHETWEMALEAIKQFAGRQEISSWHLLFPTQAISDALLQGGIHQRIGTQFHWFNKDYEDFDDFLASFNSRKRKALKKERRRVAEQGLELRTLVGGEIGPQEWEQFHHFYQLTYAKRSGHGGYLSREFFTEVASRLEDQVIMVLAYHEGSAVAGALYFRGGNTLYGRYWGCAQEFDYLHFEACYYQGIEFCIANGLQRFDPGAQGEHKIQRGFEPIPTYSNHWIAHSQLCEAVGDFTRREKAHSDAYRREASTLLPFRQE